jgi:hypothetical protein
MITISASVLASRGALNLDAGTQLTVIAGTSTSRR